MGREGAVAGPRSLVAGQAEAACRQAAVLWRGPCAGSTGGGGALASRTSSIMCRRQAAKSEPRLRTSAFQNMSGRAGLMTSQYSSRKAALTQRQPLFKQRFHIDLHVEGMLYGSLFPQVISHEGITGCLPSSASATTLPRTVHTTHYKCSCLRSHALPIA